MKKFVIAWLVSSVAFSLAFVCFMTVWNVLDHNIPSWPMIRRLSWVTICAGLVAQLVCGGIIYLILTRIGLWRLWAVTLSYVGLWVLAWNGVDTFREAWGMIGWFMIACVTAWTFWFFAS